VDLLPEERKREDGTIYPEKGCELEKREGRKYAFLGKTRSVLPGRGAHLIPAEKGKRNVLVKTGEKEKRKV